MAKEDAMDAGDRVDEYGDSLRQCVQICDEAYTCLKAVEASDAFEY